MLIADDDTVVRDVVRRYLERDGLDVLIAHNGTEALRLLGSERIDVAVLDVMMPGPDGLTLCRSLRQRGGYTIPVILLTALGEEDDRIAGLEAGADDYLTKPFSPRELALRVRSVLRRAPSPVSALPLDITVGDMTVSTAARSVTIDGEPVSNVPRLAFNLMTHTAGDVVRFKIRRGDGDLMPSLALVGGRKQNQFTDFLANHRVHGADGNADVALVDVPHVRGRSSHGQ